MAIKPMGKKILVVDDTSFFLNLMTRILEKKNHRVITAEDGFKALNILSSYVPDIMFVDLIMPKIRGDRLCQLVRKMPSMSDCYIVIVSSAISEMTYDYQKLGANACIAKDTPKGLAKSVDEAIAAAELVRRSRKTDMTGVEPTETVPQIDRTPGGEYYPVEAVLEMIPEGVLAISSGMVTIANSPALSLLGKPLDTVIGSPFREIFPEMLKPTIEKLYNASADDLKQGIEEPLVLNGRRVILRITSIDNNTGEMLITLTDVTKQGEIEQALSDSITYTENIIGSMAESLIVLNPDTTINFVNPATCAMLGYSDHELFDLPMDDILDGDLSFKKDISGELSDKGNIWNPDICYRSKSGESIPVSFIGTMMQDRDETVPRRRNIICIAHDLRPIQELQKQVLQTEKMAAAGELSAGVAHEIKNPLSIILQGIEALEYSLQTAHDRTALFEMTGRIKNAAERANTIVKGLLDFSKQSPATFRMLQTESVINQAISFVESQLAIQNIKVVRKYPRNATEIVADKNQIQQVIINLLLNSVEAMPEGGTIAIRTQRVESGGDGTYSRIEFSDSGQGIPEEEMKNIFEPFFTTKADSMNIGLGLSISQGIINKHGGAIDIKSRVGNGTVVEITLPSQRK